MPRSVPQRKSDYPHLRDLHTRWTDNDAYGHVNNMVHYSYFDSVVNAWLIERAGLDVHHSTVIGLVVDTGCQYFAPLTYPETITVGLRVAHLGRSSVRYELGLFGEGQDEAAAQGHFVHVYVERATRRPVPLPEALRNALGPLLAPHPFQEKSA